MRDAEQQKRQTSFQEADIHSYNDLKAYADNSADSNPSVQIDYKPGRPGLGLLVRGFGGDGEFSVFVHREKDEISKVVIRFDHEDQREVKEGGEKLGVVGVDSGQLLITDPHYVLPQNEQ